MYAAIRQTKLKPGTSEEVIKRAREAALPLVSAVPGFKAYYMVLGDDDALTTVSVFEDKAEHGPLRRSADAGRRRACRHPQGLRRGVIPNAWAS
jgi:heme-degrading monooxygenase HmoA